MSTSITKQELFKSFIDSKIIKVVLDNEFETTGKIYKMERKYRFGRAEYVFEICNQETPNYRFSFCLSDVSRTELI